ncbi:unnamed protein product [Ranitomeya imitator]|uniref:Uncharacterized protein n=1 Tax=Ranitomeya imitator TaxID=111125 RepID=A0ABN9KV03_9NEOB|nr:unnamed protein product [Ranitomeya imitator]
MDNDDSRICGRLCPSLIGRGNLYDIIVAMATIMTSTSILCLSLNQKHIDKSVSILYSAVTPMLNPIIYSVRNKDVKDTHMDNDDSRIRGRLCPSLIGRGNLYDIIVAMATIMTSTSILCPLLIGRGLAASTNQTRDVYILYDIIVAVPVADWSRAGGLDQSETSLHYVPIASKKMCISMAAPSWISSFSHSILEVIYTFQLSFCHSKHFNHFFFEVHPLFKIACSDILLHEIIMFITAGIIATFSFLLILVSYVQMVYTIL